MGSKLNYPLRQGHKAGSKNNSCLETRAQVKKEKKRGTRRTGKATQPQWTRIITNDIHVEKANKNLTK